MMEAKLGVTTCDKCDEPMKEGQPVLVISEGDVTPSNEDLKFEGATVRYACHRSCWDGAAEIEINPCRRKIW